MATSGDAANPRLSVDDWVQEGFRVLAEDGVKALTLGRLCSRLGVTKGSFYWHFSDMKAFRSALDLMCSESSARFQGNARLACDPMPKSARASSHAADQAPVQQAARDRAP